MCGGLSKNATFVQTHADVLKLPVVLPEVTESVLLGAAILAASAYESSGDASESKNNPGLTRNGATSGTGPTNGCACPEAAPPIIRAMERMGGDGKEITPRPEVESYHDKKYRVFMKLLDTQRFCVETMEK